MNKNEELITHFYTCFQNKDYTGMQACYADSATFSDAVFTNLNYTQVKAMWEMLIKSGKDLKLVFKNITSNENTVSAEWVAHYTFSATGNKVVNRIKANFVIENEKIVQHIDTFSFYTWAKQSLGMAGLLLGWTTFMKNKVSKQAMNNLAKFMAK